VGPDTGGRKARPCHKWPNFLGRGEANAAHPRQAISDPGLLIGSPIESITYWELFVIGYWLMVQMERTFIQY